MRLFITYKRHRYVRHVRADNFRAAPLDQLQLDVFRAFIDTLPAKGERHG